MRKVAQVIASAIVSNRSVRCQNTSYDAKTGEVRLHGNAIIFRNNQGVMVINAPVCKRWDTVTTRSRVNEVMRGICADQWISRHHGKSYIHAEDGQTYLLASL